MADEKIKIAIIGAGAGTAAIAAKLTLLDVEVIDEKNFLLVDDCFPRLKPEDLKLLNASDIQVLPVEDPPLGWYQKFNKSNPTRKKGKKR